jgi:hypothetical protein
MTAILQNLLLIVACTVGVGLLGSFIVLGVVVWLGGNRPPTARK